jgi:hypothetical protein
MGADGPDAARRSQGERPAPSGAGWRTTQDGIDGGTGRDRPLTGSRALFPHTEALSSVRSAATRSRAALQGADVVLVHAWNDPALVARIGRHRLSRGRYLLLFHTHHRAASDAGALAAMSLEAYDGVLAFGAGPVGNA